MNSGHWGIGNDIIIKQIQRQAYEIHSLYDTAEMWLKTGVNIKNYGAYMHLLGCIIYTMNTMNEAMNRLPDALQFMFMLPSQNGTLVTRPRWSHETLQRNDRWNEKFESMVPRKVPTSGIYDGEHKGQRFAAIWGENGNQLRIKLLEVNSVRIDVQLHTAVAFEIINCVNFDALTEDISYTKDDDFSYTIRGQRLVDHVYSNSDTVYLLNGVPLLTLPKENARWHAGNIKMIIDALRNAN